MENRRLPIEDVEEIVIDDDEFNDDIEDYGEYEARLVDENEVCVRVLTDGIYKEG